MTARTAMSIVATFAASILVWFQLDGLHTIVRLWTVLLIVPLPVLMIAQSRMLSQLDALPRMPAYISSIISLWALATATALAAWAGDLSVAELHLAPWPGSAVTAAASLLMTLAGVTVLLLFHAAGIRETGILRQLLPVTVPDRVLFAAVSITAGVCEEFIFRGFLLTVLAQATGSTGIAVVVSSGAFGVLHAYQHPAGALRAAILGGLLAGTLLITGSLYPAIIAHILIDLVAGLWLARLLLR